MNSLKASIDNTTTQLDIGRKQAAQLQADTDARNRYAAIEAKTAQDIAAIYPTLQACAELTNRQMGIGAMKASVAGGSSGAHLVQEHLEAWQHQLRARAVNCLR